MTLIDALKIVALKYAELRSLSHGRVSTLAFGDGTKLPNILNGEADLTTARFERTMRWFSENWPENSEWPSAVPRPAIGPVPSSPFPSAAEAIP
jgi:hypothetical protein